MENFEFHIPTKIVFGKDTINEVGKKAVNFGKKLLMVYGMGSIKKSGTYDKVIKSLRHENLEVIEFPGVKSNPVLSHAKEGIRLAKANKVDFILAVGGGSVIDEAKAIAAGALFEGNVWDFYTSKATVKAALPIIVVLTIPASSSEMNSNSAITNEAIKRKAGFHSPFLYPSISILDPTVTYTIPSNYIAYSAADEVSHLLEGYFTHSDEWSPIQNRYAEGLVKTIIESAEKALKDPLDYENKAIIMWAYTLAYNGLSVAGLKDTGIPNHMFSLTLGALFDTPHGATLSIIMPGWMKYMKNKYRKNFIQFAENIFNIKTGDDDLTLELGIIALKEWFKKIKCPVSLSEVGIKNPDLEMMANNTLITAKAWKIKGYSKKMIIDIFRECL
jgi:alcohol dehydrogenase YqhD (iron-dependent ADH family)